MREVLKETFRSFSRQGGRLLGGAVAFYALLSVAPIFVIALRIAGAVAGHDATRDALLADVAKWTGTEGAATVAEVLARADEAARVPSVVTALLLLYASTRLFSQLKRALNQMWCVPNPEHDGFEGKLVAQLRKRALALVFVVIVGAIVLALVGVKSALSVAGRYVAVPGLWQAVESLSSLAIATALFASIFKMLPDARLSARDAIRGAFVTALLFSLGTAALGAYLGHKRTGELYGPAGSLVMLLLWVHYSAQIFFLGASFTAALARRHGAGITPRSA